MRALDGEVRLAPRGPGRLMVAADRALARAMGEALWTAPDVFEAERRELHERADRLMPLLTEHGANPA